MNSIRRRAALLTIIGVVASFLIAAPAAAQNAAPAAAQNVVASAAPARATAPSDSARDCPTRPAPGEFTCYAMHRRDVTPHAAGTTTTPSGFGPSDLQSAYQLPSGTAGTGQTVYVIDAYGYVDAEKDLTAYRAQYGLPLCSTGNGCFSKVDQRGGTTYPPEDAGWKFETALDLDMVSAVCPRCHITLVQADSPSEDLFKSVSWATGKGAKFVSMSWGGPEDGTEPQYDAAYFNRAGVAYVASSGDGGFATGTSYPATSPNVVSIGGTSLRRDSSARGWSETVWGTDSSQGTGSGCSVSEAKPSWQKVIAGSVCSRRAGNDVAAVGDPNTGVAVYQASRGGWNVAGGTSASAPIITAVYALAGTPNQTPGANGPGSYPYGRIAALHDITNGNNGYCAPPEELCTAGVGWDGPTGLGTPAGVSAFSTPAQVVITNNPGDQLSSIRNPISLTVTASATPPGPAGSVRFSATGLPAGLSMSSTGVVSGVPTALGARSVSVTATGYSGSSAAQFTWTVGRAGSFVPTRSVRLLDTRNGTGAAKGPVQPGFPIAVPILGRDGVPMSGVSSVVLNVTVAAPVANGFVTVYENGKPKPGTSNLNYVKGGTAQNLVLAPVGTDGKVALAVSAGAQLIADVSGYYVKGNPVDPGAFGRLSPARLLDTRPGSPIPSAGTATVQVAGRGGVPADAAAVVLNVTATGSAASGYLTAYPTGRPRPTASILNFPAGRTVPNLVMLPLGTNGSIDIWLGGGGSTDLIVDVFGYYRAGDPNLAVPGMFKALTPHRVLDTRDGTGVGGYPVTVGGGSSIGLQVTGAGGVPDTGVSAVVLNVAVTKPTATGWITAFSDDVSPPATSNLNFGAGQTVANLVVVPVSQLGMVNLTVNGSATMTTQLFVDVAGYFVAGP